MSSLTPRVSDGVSHNFYQGLCSRPRVFTCPEGPLVAGGSHHDPHHDDPNHAPAVPPEGGLSREGRRFSARRPAATDLRRREARPSRGVRDSRATAQKGASPASWSSTAVELGTPSLRETGDVPSRMPLSCPAPNSRCRFGWTPAGAPSP